MFRRKDPEVQASQWLPIQELPKTAATSFYQRLDRALTASGFGDALRELCAPYDEMDRSQRGRLGIDASVMEANASLRSLEHRLTGEDYQGVRRRPGRVGRWGRLGSGGGTAL